MTMGQAATTGLSIEQVAQKIGEQLVHSEIRDEIGFNTALTTWFERVTPNDGVGPLRRAVRQYLLDNYNQRDLAERNTSAMNAALHEPV